MSKLRELRTERRMTQSELAYAVGVSQPFIVDLERGARGAKTETMKRIASVLNCSIDDLIGNPNDTTEQESA